MKYQVKIVLLLAAALMMTACTKKVKEAPVDPNAGTTQTAPPSDQGTGIAEEGAFTPADLDSNSCLRQRVVLFGFDQDLVNPEYQALIACHTKYLRDRPGAQMRLEGHTDERGTREYNLGLGERRANALLSAFIASGAPGARIEAVSFGEERPVCLESDESCWAKNRRVEIVYTVK